MRTAKIILKLAKALDLELLEDRHRTGPRKYRLKSLALAILFRYLLRLSSDRDYFSELRRACKLKEAPSLSTISRARGRIDLSGIFYQLVAKAKEIGLARGFILSVDSTQFEAYLKGDKEAKLGYCAAKEDWIFGYKAHIVTDAESELPVAVVVTPANEADSNQFFPLMKRIWKNFTHEVKKLLADAGYDASKIRKFLREHGILGVIDRRRYRQKGTERPKDPDYRKRIASERVNSHAKDGFALERFTVAGLQRALQHVYACLSAMLFSAIGCSLLGMKDWRRLVV